jgi:glycosyltransferase involved in cell wall biosynthesis
MQQRESATITTVSASSQTNAKKMRVLLLCSHPTQYSAPMWRRISRHPQMDPLVAYCSLQGAEAKMDPGFGVTVAWDVPLLNDYRWVRLRNFSLHPRVGPFLGLVNPGVWRLIRKQRFDAIAVFTGYMCATFWIAFMAAKVSGTPLIYGTDATTLHSVDGRNWKTKLKEFFWPKLFRMADVVVAPSSGTVALMRSLGISQDRIQLMPYVVDNEWWTEKAVCVDRKAVRRGWGIPEDASVVLFCAKLQPWKRPQDLLRAFARAGISDAYLVYAGDGMMRGQLEAEAAELQVRERVRFLGFVNQSALPAVYRSSDVMVLPSEYEPFGLVVNEAMLCGCPVIVSDRVGARFDLIRENETGFVYPACDVEALTTVLHRALASSERLTGMGEAAHHGMSVWSPEAYVESFVKAARQAKKPNAAGSPGMTLGSARQK